MMALVLKKFFRVTSLVFGLSLLGGVAAAQQSVSDVTDTGVLIAENPSIAEVQGFRSARFGMDEVSVRQAISSDFGLEGEQVVAGENNVERTKVLTIIMPDVLENGGIAKISYVFGYSSKALIQVGISWSFEADPAMTDALLVANGDVLRSHFLSQGFVPSSVTINTPIDSGILLFRGADAEGRSAILLLQGEFEGSGEGQKTLLPNNLALLYSLSPDNPDVFKIKSGNF